MVSLWFGELGSLRERHPCVHRAWVGSSRGARSSPNGRVKALVLLCHERVLIIVMPALDREKEPEGKQLAVVF